MNSSVERPFPGTRYPVRDDFSGPGGNAGNRRDFTDLRDGETVEFGEESTGSSSAATGREADFLRSFRAAMRDSKRDAHEQQHAQDEQPEPNVLAIARQQLWTGLPSPADASVTIENESSSIESVVASITETIDRLIRAEMAPRAGAPLNIRFALSEQNLGLAGLRIAITQTTMDVVLEHSGSGMSDELIRAAGTLADRLMKRFSKKTVRIIAAPSEQQDAEHEAAAVPASLHQRP
jgi:hypothetical protein